MNNEELENNEFVEEENNFEEELEETNNNQEETEEILDNEPKEKKKKHSPCIIATGILATLAFIGVVVIFIMSFCCKDGSCGSPNASSPATVVQTGDLKIAYVNTDSVLANYEYAKDLEKGLKVFQTSLESNYQAQGQKLQSDYENYLKTGDKLTLTEQKRKEEELTRRQQEFPMLQQKMMAQLQERQLEDNKKLLNAVYAFIKDYNSKNQKYNIILSRSYISSSILYADEGLDITNEIIKGLNQEYKDIKGK
ncbi:MAG: OmpH family outer membrane protein [Bacteroidales bacterium]|jgi:outer membrane protein|nr:OmpH family outer membrane protein [Bacteroidales bacterium]MDD4702776.1 OmpH family outer membrane protein [Bacteroidales bacterium]MDX9798274.1 OmpH family outer membrane protein [Bacteroidales bacterium]